MSKLKGIVLYDIQLDGALAGVYTNNDSNVYGTILPESARLVKQYPDTVSGTQIFEYDCLYFDFPTGGVECRLIFDLNGTVYKARWEDLKGNVMFKGEGFRMNDRQIAISYWPV